MSPLRLRTFGGLSVIDRSGEPVRGAAALRRPFALMAIVAASQPMGLTRDQLVGILWPDVDQRRAAHCLTQTLYAARRGLDADDLFIIDGRIRLNATIVTSDVGALEVALAAGDLKAVWRLYSGRFLDGFYLSSAGEFERWVAGKRDQIDERVVGALAQLAATAAQSTDLRLAIEVRTAMARIHPLDSSNAFQLVTLLAQTGNPGEAIRQAKAHTDAVASQLEVEPEPALSSLVDHVRRIASRAPDPLASRWPLIARDEPPALARIDAPSAGPTAAQNEDPGEPSHRRLAGSRSTRFFRLGVATAVVALLAAVVVRQRPKFARADSDVRSAGQPLSSVAVVPFDASGVSAPSAYLANTAVQLIATRLAIDSVVETLDPAVIVSSWRQHGLDRREVSHDSVLHFARALGARSVVSGAITGNRDHLALNAVLVRVSDGTTLARASAEGSTHDLSLLVTQLTAKLLTRVVGDPDVVAGEASISLASFQRYVAGRLSEREGRATDAMLAYEQALSLDSLFSTAALHLAIAADRSGNADLEADALGRAWAHRDRLDAQSKVVLASFLGPRYPEPSTAAEQLAAWERLPRTDEHSARMWQQLAANLFHEGQRLGLVGVGDQARLALDRAAALQRDYAPTASLRAIMGSQDADARPLREWQSGRSGFDESRILAMTALWHSSTLGHGGRAVEDLQSRATTQSERIDAVLAAHSLALNQGRIADALATTRALRELRPDSHAALRLRVLDALYGGGDTVAAKAALSALASERDSAFAGVPLMHRRRDADRCVVGQWLLAHSDTAGARQVLDRLRASRERGWRAPALVGAPPNVCLTLLDVSFAVVAGAPDALHRLARLDSLMLTPAVAGYASTYSHLLVSRLYSRLGHARGALAALRKRDYMLGWPTYLAATLHEEDRLLAFAADRR